MTPDHRAWLEDILNYAHFVLDDERVHRNWVVQTNRDSSIVDLGELIDQIYLEMDAKNVLKHLFISGEINSELRSAIQLFIEGLNDAFELLPEEYPINAVRLLKSPEWQYARTAAGTVLDVSKKYYGLR